MSEERYKPHIQGTQEIKAIKKRETVEKRAKSRKRAAN